MLDIVKTFKIYPIPSYSQLFKYCKFAILNFSFEYVLIVMTDVILLYMMITW